MDPNQPVKRLKPLNDFIFKRLFGEEEAKDNLIALLNAVLEREGPDRLVSLEIIENKELTKEMLEDKTGRLDVRAKTEDGIQLNIEVQLTDQGNMDKRTLFYWGKLFLEGIKQGQDYKELCKVITINILDFNFLEVKRFHSSFHLWEDNEKDYMLSDLVEIRFIELPKFRAFKEKSLKDNSLHRWLVFFEKDISEETLMELMEMDQNIKKAEERLEMLSSDPETIALYRAREDSLHERANMINSAEERGRKKGKEEGIEEGKRESKMEVVQQWLRDDPDADIKKVAKIVGMDEEEVRRIRQEMMN